MCLNKNLPRWRGIKGVVSAQALQTTYWQSSKIMVKQLRFIPLDFASFKSISTTKGTKAYTKDTKINSLNHPTS